jgi:hypothetical protein
VVRNAVLALGANDRNACERSRLVWTICMSSERVKPRLAMNSKTVLSVRRETFNKALTKVLHTRMPP